MNATIKQLIDDTFVKAHHTSNATFYILKWFSLVLLAFTAILTGVFLKFGLIVACIVLFAIAKLTKPYADYTFKMADFRFRSAPHKY